MRILCGLGVVLVSFLLACSDKEHNDDQNGIQIKFTQYSRFVNDTFHIQLQVPRDYYSKPDKKYPVVVLLDGNFYYPIMSSIVRQYEIAGLLPPVILVGVGYKSFIIMDSLRVRDYLFPKALPSDELESDGGGLNFYNYLTRELLPKVDGDYRAESANRTLLGHSFGGYFALYSLFHQATTNSNEFRNFISASPSLWYNNFYLNQLPEQLAKAERPVGLFLSVGEMEDSTWSVKPLADVTREIGKRKIKGLEFNSRIYNHLEHMDVAILTFTKGLQEMVKAKEQ
jgi:predicted alpha/beta superfamily hydrolase